MRAISYHITLSMAVFKQPLKDKSQHSLLFLTLTNLLCYSGSSVSASSSDSSNTSPSMPTLPGMKSAEIMASPWLNQAKKTVLENKNMYSCSGLFVSLTKQWTEYMNWGFKHDHVTTCECWYESENLRAHVWADKPSTRSRVSLFFCFFSFCCFP